MSRCGEVHRAPDTRHGPAPRRGELLLARPGLGPVGFPAVVVSPAERWAADGSPLPYRAEPHARRTGVALYLGAGSWAPARLGAAELARLSTDLAAWPAWREALTGALAMLAEASALAPCPAPRALAALRAALARPPRAAPPPPWRLRGAPVERVGGG